MSDLIPIGDQGEIYIAKIDKLPDTATKPVKRTPRGYIVSHSENGAHHLLSDGELLERTEGVPAGMKILYAIIESPERLYQDDPVPHDHYDLDPGIYEFRISREYDPFAEQARIVAD